MHVYAPYIGELLALPILPDALLKQVPRQYRRRLRQEIYYCDRYGVQSHLEAITGREAEAIQPAEIRQYLQSLLGKIHFVLQVNPQDASFQQSREQVTAWLQAVPYKDGIISPES